VTENRVIREDALKFKEREDRTMLDWIRRKLGVASRSRVVDLEETLRNDMEELDEIRDRLKELEQRVEQQPDEPASMEDVRHLRNRIAEQEPETARFTEREYQVLEALAQRSVMSTTQEIARDLPIDSRNVRAQLNNLKNKVEITEESQGPGKPKKYRLPRTRAEQIFGTEKLRR